MIFSLMKVPALKQRRLVSQITISHIRDQDMIRDQGVAPPNVVGDVTVGRNMTTEEALAEADRCLQCVNAPCASACPAKTHPNKFLRQLKFENPLGGAETVLDNNPLGGVCGQVCPVSELCEGACVRKDIDTPVKIGHVQKYLHSYGIKEGVVSPPVAAPTGHKAAIIGAGPSGLACARELARKGSTVTIFETRSEGGGALRFALSPFRVSHSLVNEEVERVKQMGVTIQYNTMIEDVMALREKGFHDVFVSTGLQRGKHLPHIPINTACLTALSFLEHANQNHDNIAQQLSTGKTVTVIGGGSVAMDCAVTAMGLGATAAHVIAIEKESEFPADEEEIALALKLGVKFHGESRVMKCDLERSCVMIETHTSSGLTSSAIQSTCIIMAVGQQTDDSSEKLLSRLIKPSIQDMSKLEFWPWATKEKPLDEKPFGVFYGGDLVRTGGDIVVRAVADGKRAAASILPATRNARREKVSLSTEFVGLSFENPFTISSNFSDSADAIARAYDLGWSGSYFNTLTRHPDFRKLPYVCKRPLNDCMNDVYDLRSKYPSKVTGVSIMGKDLEDWAYLAAAAEGAGAQVIEMNLFSSHHIEQYTSAVRRAVDIPVIVKLSLGMKDTMEAALAAQEGGANGISVLGSRKQLVFTPFDRLEVSQAEKGFPGRYQAMTPTLKLLTEFMEDDRLHVDISGMGGLYTWKDGVEFLSLGASNLQVATAVSKYGPVIIEELVDGLQRYLKRYDFNSTDQLIDGHGRLVQKCGFDSVRDLLERPPLQG